MEPRYKNTLDRKKRLADFLVEQSSQRSAVWLTFTLFITV